MILALLLLLLPAPQFIWARLQYTSAHDDSYLKGWYTDAPDMDDHIIELVTRLTKIQIAKAVVKPSSPRLFDYPFVYSVEPEQIVFSDKEAANMRSYLARGGFWFADDFHGQEELDMFIEQLHKVLPNARLEELTPQHELFHVFFDIGKFVQVVNDGLITCAPECPQWENGDTGREPKFFAVYDSIGRMVVLAAWNTDLGDGLEWADVPWYPQPMSAYAVRVITNVIIYSLTH